MGSFITYPIDPNIQRDILVYVYQRPPLYKIGFEHFMEIDYRDKHFTGGSGK